MEMTQFLPQFSVILFILLSHYCADGKLEINKTDSPVEVRPGDNTTLPCLFYGFEASPLDLSKVAVKWTLRTSEEEEKLVYWFRGGDHNQTRPGSNIPHSGLMEGDGSLYIPDLQSSDEGEYTCTVIVTPENAISKVTMEVSAKPTCTVSDSRLKMYPDTEKSVRCHVNGFYPEHVRIHWVKDNKASSRKSELDSRTWIRVPVQNPDGTYNVTSLLTVRPMSTDEDGDVYSCEVFHRSLKDDVLTCNFTISVQPEPGFPIWVYIIGILLLLVLIGIIYSMYKYATPRVSKITGQMVYTKDSEEGSKLNEKELNKKNTLTSTIESLRLKKLFVKLCVEILKDKEKEILNGNEETRRLLTWSSANPSTMPEKEGVRLVVVPSKRRGCIFCRYDCNIEIDPLDKLHGAALILEVSHGDEKSTIVRHQRISVIGQFNRCSCTLLCT